MKIGVISDTHGYLDPAVAGLFEGVDHILHAGDVGGAFITFQLEQIAPVTAVLGNTDQFLPLRETEVTVLGGWKFLVHHIVNPLALVEPVKGRIERERPDAVIFGHTHQAFRQTVGRILYLNPGYAGKARSGLTRSVAIVHCDKDGIRAEHLKLG